MLLGLNIFLSLLLRRQNAKTFGCFTFLFLEYFKCCKSSNLNCNVNNIFIMVCLLFVKSLNVAIHYMHSLQEPQERDSFFWYVNLYSVHKTSEHRSGTFSIMFFSEIKNSQIKVSFHGYRWECRSCNSFTYITCTQKKPSAFTWHNINFCIYRSLEKSQLNSRTSHGKYWFKM